MRERIGPGSARAALCLVALLALGGCPEAPPGTGAAGPAGVAGPIDPALARAPELFSASGVALWNGSRTVGGAWVAHPAADKTRRVRVVNAGTGVEVDAALYRPQRSRGGDIIIVSSDAAEALGLEPGEPTHLALFGLRPAEREATGEEAAGEPAATDPAERISRMNDNEVLQLVAAAVRGMGYATAFEAGDGPGALPGIRAVPEPRYGPPAPHLRVLVRPRGSPPMTAQEIAARQQQLAGSGAEGMVVSLGGFEADAGQALDPAGPPVRTVDLDGLVALWRAEHDRLSAPDRALLPIETTPPEQEEATPSAEDVEVATPAEDAVTETGENAASTTVRVVPTPPDELAPSSGLQLSGGMPAAAKDEAAPAGEAAADPDEAPDPGAAPRPTGEEPMASDAIPPAEDARAAPAVTEPAVTEPAGSPGSVAAPRPSDPVPTGSEEILPAEDTPAAAAPDASAEPAEAQASSSASQ